MRIVISIMFIVFAVASFSFAEGGDGLDSVVMAKADTEVSTVRNVITDGEDSSDISLLTERGLAKGLNADRTYESQSLNVEDIPLVISSADKKTVSIVLPPFLYFKQQF